MIFFFIFYLLHQGRVNSLIKAVASFEKIIDYLIARLLLLSQNPEVFPWLPSTVDLAQFQGGQMDGRGRKRRGNLAEYKIHF